VNPSFVVYIDESGDEGFRFGKGSSDWFILSAAITRKANDLETVKLVDEVCKQLKKTTCLHFKKLSHEQKVLVVDRIANARLRSVSVLVHKPSLNEPEKFQEGYRLYFYAIRYLLERISWCCRDHRDPGCSGDGSAQLILSNRSSMSYEEMRGYLDRLKGLPAEREDGINWSIIRTNQLTAAAAASLMGLQIVDAIAGSLYHAVTPSTHGFTEPRYARMLKPIIYRGGRNRQYRGYGIKIWPREADERAKTAEHFAWFRDHYK
jgi:hypothetical protein